VGRGATIQEDLDDIQAVADAEMDAAVEFGKASPFPDKAALTADVYVGDSGDRAAGDPA
jgi:TPP-dependent pyruvate/acetoin dehydrogenase alpha subunit